MIEAEDSTKNDFSSNLIAIIPDLTTNLVFLVISSSLIRISLLDCGYSV